MTTRITQSLVAKLALAWPQTPGHPILHHLDLAPSEPIAGRKWFLPWRTITGDVLAAPGLPELQVALDVIDSAARLLGDHPPQTISQELVGAAPNRAGTG